MYLGKSRETSSVSIPRVEEEPKTPSLAEVQDDVDAKTDVKADVKADARIDAKVDAKDVGSDTKLSDSKKDALALQVPKETEEVKSDGSVEAKPKDEVLERPATSSGWLEWMGISGGNSQPEQSHQTEGTPSADVSAPATDANATNNSAEPLSDVGSSSSSTTSAAPTRSWFSLWSATAGPGSTERVNEQMPVKLTGQTSSHLEGTPCASAAESKASNTEPVTGSSWAFWSREEKTKPASKAGSTTEEVGEIAVSGETSQDHPQPAKTTSSKRSKTGKSAKGGREVASDSDDQKAALLDGSVKGTSSQSAAPSKTLPPNLLLPSFNSTYQMMENPSIIEQLKRLLMYQRQAPSRHLHIVKEPPRIKKALAIGIHGLFPAPLLRTVIGQPTGTSIKFANHAADAIRRWTEKQGYDCEIEKVALEGEGKIGERVDNLWKLLLNWIEHVRSADFILVACHSQGVPVATMLVAKLIELDVVSTARIGVCAMAGVSLGPFADYKSRLFSGSAGELFEFANPESVVSVRLEESLRIALKHGVRITYCGSIDDQLVSVEVKYTCCYGKDSLVNQQIVIDLFYRQPPIYL
jgi:hypothetical protein